MTETGNAGDMDDAARERLLQLSWAVVRGLSPQTVTNYPAARRAIDAGADPTDMATAMSAAAMHPPVPGVSCRAGVAKTADGRSARNCLTAPTLGHIVSRYPHR